MISLPIPDDGSRLRYSDCLAHHDVSYLGLLRALGITRIRYPSAGATIWLDTASNPGVHLDPDLRARTRPREQGWRALFGQVGAAQSHLANCGVGPGDVFLFFGWFAHIEEHSEGCFRYLPRVTWTQALWGWLEIAEVVAASDAEARHPWSRSHPHVAARHLSRYQKNNVIYVATERSSIVDGLPGAGVFDWSPNVRLTRAGMSPRNWLLPLAFHPDHTHSPMTGQEADAWSLADGGATLRAAAIGQEFVVVINEGIHRWLAQLLAGNQPKPR